MRLCPCTCPCPCRGLCSSGCLFHQSWRFGNETQTFGAGGIGFRLLQRADPQQLAKFIHNEHPQTIALILSRLDAAPAATLLNSLPPELRGDVAVRMASLDQISPEIIHKITSVIGQR